MHGANNFAFIDGANLYYTYENLDWDLDYAKLRTYLKNKLGVTFAYYFWGKIKENTGLYKTVESCSYIMKLKDPTQYTTDEEGCPFCHKVIVPEMVRRKSNCDSFMTLEIISNLSIYDRAVIITSDGDFDELIEELLRKDKLKLVFAPCRKGCSGLLISAARGRIAYMDDFRAVLEKTLGDNPMGI